MKMKNVRGGYILISLDMIDISDDDSVIEIDFSRLTESKKSIRLCNINVGGEHKPDIDIKPDFGEDSITLSDVYGFDLVVSADNSVEITEHRSAYELPIPEVSDAGKTIIVDSEGKYALEVSGGLPTPTESDRGKALIVNNSLNFEYRKFTRLYKHSISITGLTVPLIIISPQSLAYTHSDFTSSSAPDLSNFLESFISFSIRSEYDVMFAITYTGSAYGGQVCIRSFSESEGVLSRSETKYSLYDLELTFTDTVTEL